MILSSYYEKGKDLDMITKKKKIDSEENQKKNIK
jgi:hypothetical protein